MEGNSYIFSDTINCDSDCVIEEPSRDVKIMVNVDIAQDGLGSKGYL